MNAKRRAKARRSCKNPKAFPLTKILKNAGSNLMSAEFLEDESRIKSNLKDENCIYKPDAPKKKCEDALGIKCKNKKDPLPMKLRAFPESFWQQPNKTASVSPGVIYCVPPPLSKEENTSDNRDALEEARPGKYHDVVTEPNIDLLFSLFRSVEEEQKKILGRENTPVVRRGRPRKPKKETKVIRDDDPYLTSSATESFYPLLPSRNNKSNVQSKIVKDLQIAEMGAADAPSPTFSTAVSSNNKNYSQILSELVVQL